MQHYPGEKNLILWQKLLLIILCFNGNKSFSMSENLIWFFIHWKILKRKCSTDYFSKLFMKVICLNLLIQLIWSKTCLITELLIWSSPMVRSSFCQWLQKESLKRDMKVKCLFALLISLPGLFTECFHYEGPSASWEG